MKKLPLMESALAILGFASSILIVNFLGLSYKSELVRLHSTIGFISAIAGLGITNALARNRNNFNSNVIFIYILSISMVGLIFIKNIDEFQFISSSTLFIFSISTGCLFLASLITSLSGMAKTYGALLAIMPLLLCFSAVTDCASSLTSPVLCQFSFERAIFFGSVFQIALSIFCLRKYIGFPNSLVLSDCRNLISNSLVYIPINVANASQAFVIITFSGLGVFEIAIFGIISSFINIQIKLSRHIFLWNLSRDVDVVTNRHAQQINLLLLTLSFPFSVLVIRYAFQIRFEDFLYPLLSAGLGALFVASIARMEGQLLRAGALAVVTLTRVSTALAFFLAMILFSTTFESTTMLTVVFLSLTISRILVYVVFRKFV